MFIMRNEAYLGLIVFLKSRVSVNNENILEIYIKNLQICFENHRQDHTAVFSEVEPLLQQLINLQELNFAKDLALLINGLKAIDFIKTSTPEQRFRNEIRRYFESVIAVDLLQNPTKKCRRQRE